MDSMSRTSDSKGDNNEVAGSSSSGWPLLINNGSINSSPKAKLRKGKKIREEASEENKHIPWSIMGDFNAVLRPSDRSGGASAWQ
ncbi:hypothetical protein OIU84_017550 [Salix udensis]|uniref:Uncharacterized protein n=1 Tax=Salix udensis TaxID=889485 RepID=A0AAD6L4B7_9ROSI|nr:hypothetical protein OIU84_017550 [Salix udensis]